MAESTKKKTTATKPATAAKPRKAPAKKSANGLEANPVAETQTAAAHGRSLPHDEVARLAHRFWQERGHKHGQHEDDWYRAEQELNRRAS